MEDAERRAKQQELRQLRQRLTELESELAEGVQPQPWRATGYYTSYYATTGFLLGAFGAVSSLLFNVVGAALFDKHPLKLIQVYLTFPLGENALEMDHWLALTVGCCLYIGTGMVLGIPFQLVLARFVPNATLLPRLGVASVLALGLWVFNFYAVLSWLQPLLFGGNWIVEQVPPIVAALTHLVFGWTMALIYPLGTYVPYRLQTETS